MFDAKSFSPVNVEETDTIGAVKAKIEAQAGFAANQQRLHAWAWTEDGKMMPGQTLQDAAALKDCGIDVDHVGVVLTT